MQVVATHPYEGEDDDELTFEKGVVILVVAYEDPEDEVITEAIYISNISSCYMQRVVFSSQLSWLAIVGGAGRICGALVQFGCYQHGHE